MGYCPCFGLWKKPKSRQISQDFHEVSRSKGSVSVELDPSVRREGLDVIEKGRIFTYQELAIATKGFSEESFIGQGGFGAVYRGQLNTGEIVAVKQLNQAGLQGDKEFLVEVLMLSVLRHPNLVTLIGYCAEGEQRLLVYEYMPLGALEDQLHDLLPDMEPLDWNSRIMIAAGAANGLSFLHNEADPPVIYRDLKSSNILLGEGFHPKLSDFGLAKFGPVEGKTHVSTRVMGTHGYCAPEYALSGKLTMKSDIYSFGVVLLELVTGHRALENVNGHAKYLVEWTRPILKNRRNVIKLADRKLRGQFPPSALRKVIDVASLCIRDDPNTRPSMKDVASALNFIKNHRYDSDVANKTMRRKEEENRSPTETTVILEKDLERERAVAEAKMWGETWREKSKQGSDYDLIK